MDTVAVRIVPESRKPAESAQRCQLEARSSREESGHEDEG